MTRLECLSAEMFRMDVFQKSEEDFEEFNPLPFSRYIRIEHGAFHPRAVAGWRPGVEHLKWITRVAKCARNHSFYSGPLQHRRRRGHCTHRFLRADWCSEFLRGSGDRHRGRD